MSTEEEKIVYLATHAGENPEKAAMPFVMANAALAMDVKAVIALQGNGVYLALKGYTDTMLPGGGFPPMNKLIQDFLELGGKLLVCVPCIKERHIEQSDLIKGAELTAGGALTQEILTANASLVY
jgi:uncharacterized protein